MPQTLALLKPQLQVPGCGDGASSMRSKLMLFLAGAEQRLRQIKSARTPSRSIHSLTPGKPSNHQSNRLNALWRFCGRELLGNLTTLRISPVDWGKQPITMP